jgi:high-affinity nickel-transport protein
MEIGVLALGVGGSLGVLGGALALGLRHGIDWDHIAAITDITSTTTATSGPNEGWLTDEPGVLLTDESDHVAAELARRRPVAGGGTAAAVPLPAAVGLAGTAGGSLLASQRRAVFLASLYAIGHGTMVTALGLLAILAAGFLPTWVDPVMERVVGVTLVLLAGYLFYSLYRYFRGKGEFRIRSRWMLIFAGVRNAVNWLWARARGEREHVHVHGAAQYGPKTAYTIGLIHGIGAETGTQVLIIATAVGAGTKAMGLGALLFFVVGLLISNSFVTVATAAGFVSARRRQLVYVLAGLLAAVFSLVIGLIFLLEAGGVLPDLGTYFRWLGGPDA